MINDNSVRPSTPSLFADALSQLAILVETEIRLVKTEVSEKISVAVRAIVVILVAAVLLLSALFLLLIGFVELLIAFGLRAWEAYWMVGIAIAIIGGVAAFIALRKLSADQLMPKRSLSQLGKDVDVVKEQVR